MLSYSEWNGFVTYTGIGRWINRDVSDYLVEWLTGVPAPSMTEVAEIIEYKGTRLLREIERRARHHYGQTFTLAGFSDQVPQAYVISNYEDCFGNSRSIIDEHLTVTTRSLGYAEKATVIVTGYKPAVPRADRRMLAMVATKYPGDGLRIRRKIAKLNADAASRSKDKVSSECVVLSFRSDGTGASLLSGETGQIPRQLPQIMNGIDTNKFLTESLKKTGFDLSQARIVQVGFASSRPEQEADAPRVACKYAAVDPDSSGYKLIEIKSPEFELITSWDINDHGEVVGTGRAGLRSDQPQNIPWSYIDGQVVRLNYAGSATAVNNEKIVAALLQGTDVPPPSWQRAAVYIGGRLVELPLYHGLDESPERSDSEISAINSFTLMAGSVAVQRDKSGPLDQLPAVFRVDQAIQVFDGVRANYGCRASGVNDQGHVLIMAGIGHFDARSILWNPIDDSWHYVGDDTTNVYPIAVNDHDVVLGQARNREGEPVAVVCQPGGSWERLGTPDNWIPISMNNKGEVVGRVMIDLLQRPWLHSPDGRTVMLPHLTDHHTNPARINNPGQIAGGATADNDFHALLWTVE
jgi:hypothetical protein